MIKFQIPTHRPVILDQKVAQRFFETDKSCVAQPQQSEDGPSNLQLAKHQQNILNTQHDSASGIMISIYGVIQLCCLILQR